MKYRLSFHQRYPLYIEFIGIPYVFCLTIGFIINRFWGFAIEFAIFTILASIPLKRLSMALCSVVFTEEGVSVESKKGKKRIFLKWEEIKVYTVTADVQYGGQYICLSSNANIKELRTYFFGVVWAIYEEKNTISLPTDSAMISFCSKKLEPYGVQVKYTRNPNTRQF